MCTTTPRHPLDYAPDFDRYMPTNHAVLLQFERLAYVTISLESRASAGNTFLNFHSFSIGLNRTAAPTNNSQLADYAWVRDNHKASPGKLGTGAAHPSLGPKRVTTQLGEYVYAIELVRECR